jgi:hypothetical protein
MGVDNVGKRNVAKSPERWRLGGRVGDEVCPKAPECLASRGEQGCLVSSQYVQLRKECAHVRSQFGVTRTRICPNDLHGISGRQAPTSKARIGCWRSYPQRKKCPRLSGIVGLAPPVILRRRVCMTVLPFGSVRIRASPIRGHLRLEELFLSDKCRPVEFLAVPIVTVSLVLLQDISFLRA